MKLEEANALGFSSVEQCREHQRWLETQKLVTKKATTFLVQIVLKGHYEADGWEPWINCKENDGPRHIALLAIHKFIRENGYAAPRSEFEPFEVDVLVADKNSPRHENGRPMVCHCFKMKISPMEKS